MLYGNESISYYSRSNVSIWMSMAFQAGILNVAGLMACGSFVSHVSGFGTLFGYEMSKTNHSHAAALLIVPFFFLIGCMLSGICVDLRLKTHKKPKYYISFGIIFFLILAIFLLGISGYFGKFGEQIRSGRDYGLLIALCLVCGVQNGTITTVSKSVIRTTHLTGITTDLGIGIIRFLNRHKLGKEVVDEGKANFMRIGIISFFTLGSLVGALAYSNYGYEGFVIPVTTSGLLFIMMLYHQFFKTVKTAATPSTSEKTSA